MIRIEDVTLVHASLTEDPEFIVSVAEAVNASMIPLKIVKNPHASLEVGRQRAPRDDLVQDHRAIIRRRPHIDDVIDRVIVVEKFHIKTFDFFHLFQKKFKREIFHKLLT